MAHASEAETAAMTPKVLIEQLRDAASLLQGHGHRRACLVQRIRHPPRSFELPGLDADLLVHHLAGPLFAEAGDPDGRCERRWISPGEVGITPVDQPIRRSFKGTPDVVLVHLDPTSLRATAEEMFGCDPASVHLIPKLAQEDGTADRLIRLLVAEAEEPMAGGELAYDALACALSIHTLRFHSNLSAPRPAAPAALPPGRVRKVCEYMRANLDQPMTLAKLAAVAGLSASRFGRAFRDTTGEPPHRFLTRLRVEKACELLGGTDDPLVDIALRCGFGEASHFATSFRKARGMTPREWRRLRRG